MLIIDPTIIGRKYYTPKPQNPIVINFFGLIKLRIIEINSFSLESIII